MESRSLGGVRVRLPGSIDKLGSISYTWWFLKNRFADSDGNL